jgi:hypothetical protein
MLVLFCFIFKRTIVGFIKMGEWSNIETAATLNSVLSLPGLENL